MQRVYLFILLILLATFPYAVMADCSSGAEPCELETDEVSGTYYVALPSGQAPTEGWPAIVFLHGFGGEGKGVLTMRDMVQVANKRGYAVIAPDGTKREGGPGLSWLFHPLYRDGRDEGAFIGAVADDAAGRFGIDRSKVILAGFSLGASMTSYVACETPKRFSAYTPIAGSFWKPLPETCAAPVRQFYTHGWSDNVVPLEGRPVGVGSLMQGDAFAAMSIWRHTNKCKQPNPTGFDRTGNFQIRDWNDCGLRFALHPGGHGVPPGWVEMMLNWYESENMTQ